MVHKIYFIKTLFGEPVSLDVNRLRSYIFKRHDSAFVIIPFSFPCNALIFTILFLLSFSKSSNKHALFIPTIKVVSSKRLYCYSSPSVQFLLSIALSHWVRGYSLFFGGGGLYVLSAISGLSFTCNLYLTLLRY